MLQCLPSDRYDSYCQKTVTIWRIFGFSSVFSWQFSKFSQKIAKRNDLVVGTVYVFVSVSQKIFFAFSFSHTVSQKKFSVFVSVFNFANTDTKTLAPVPYFSKPWSGLMYRIWEQLRLLMRAIKESPDPVKKRRLWNILFFCKFTFISSGSSDFGICLTATSRFFKKFILKTLPLVPLPNHDAVPCEVKSFSVTPRYWCLSSSTVPIPTMGAFLCSNECVLLKAPSPRRDLPKSRLKKLHFTAYSYLKTKWKN